MVYLIISVIDGRRLRTLAGKVTPSFDDADCLVEYCDLRGIENYNIKKV